MFRLAGARFCSAFIFSTFVGSCCGLDLHFLVFQLLRTSSCDTDCLKSCFVVLKCLFIVFAHALFGLLAFSFMISELLVLDSDPLLDVLSDCLLLSGSPFYALLLDFSMTEVLLL